MAHVLEERDKSYERIQRDKFKGKSLFIAVMRKAKEIAASRNTEILNFRSPSNSDKAYRDDYIKRISHSLCEKQLSRDGRIRDHEGEQALVKNRKEGEAIHMMNREEGNVIREIGFNKSSAEESDVTDLDFPVYEKEEETLKERKREEQLEKARSMERKKKVVMRAQKEAEKELKADYIYYLCYLIHWFVSKIFVLFFQECEKKAKKKAAANSSPPPELDRAINELKRSFRYKHPGRGTEALPKAILNRRKAHKYSLWGLSSAALALALCLLFLFLQ
ncbi:hypothetical protein BRARA_A03146 [Brassica rapa]|uniref:Uncharacterized protein n=1 Tax=Brassica campestris TaxID=3711 RepID=A0A398AYD3_BRACM|nr:hypothetical protein BRARA_A03146 [Brassica rapa]